MFDLFFTGNATWFSIPAFVGTLIFLMRLGLLMLGGHGLHIGDQADMAIGHGAGSDHGDSSGSARVLSLEALTAAMMGVGWGGLAALKGTDWPLTWVMAVSIGSGVAMVLLQMLLLRMVYQLQSSGNLSLKDTMGTEGVVYIAIPGGKVGKGQVTLVMNQSQRQINAITGGEELPSKTRVRVVGVNDDNTVTVERAA